MKNKIDRMKTPAMHLSKRTVALILSVIMLVSSIATGSMLNTFAAYIKDNAAKTDAIADAASEGSAIAESAIPSEDADAAAQADDADEKPDLSGFEESEIVRKMKDDLVATGAKAELASTGWTTGNNGRLHISFDNGSNYEDIFINSDGYGDFEISTTCSVKFKFVAENTWYGYKDGSVGNNPGTDHTKNYYASSSGGDITASFAPGKYVFKYENRSDSNATLEYKFYKKTGVYHGGNDSGSWTKSDMTYNGSDVYKYTISGDGKQKRFRVNWKDGATETVYEPYQANFDLKTTVKDGNHYDSFDHGYGVQTGSSSSTNYFYFDTKSGYTYTVWLKNSKVWLTHNEPLEEAYYLTGWLNGSSESGETHKFTKGTGDNWTYTFTPSGDEGGYQYMTIKKSDGTVYHANTLNAGSGTAASATTDTDTQADNKWRAAAVSGQTVTLTWNSSTKVLSWTTSGAVTTGSWKYTSTNADASPEQTGSSTYNFVWSNNDNGPGKSGTTAISAKNGGSEYWADITTYCKNNSHFYFALSDNTSNGGIRGNKSEQINGTTIAAGNTVTMTNGSGQTIFYVEMIEKSSVSGNAYFQLVRGVDWTKISSISVSATYSGSGAVNYKYYYKEVGSTDEQVTSVTVYAKDGAAPIDWDNKGSGGASATSGTAYNYAAIATTAISQIDGATPASGVVSTVNVGDASSQYQTATVDAGKSIRITTTIANTSPWRTKYYVRGWCINGVTYTTDGNPGINTTVNSDGVYTMTYTIPAEPEVDYLEITPIYYISSAWASTNSVTLLTFYVEGYNTIQSKWGNTPYVYPFYGNLNNVSNSFGVYPGQPMVYAEGKYSTQIPLKDIPISGASTGTAIKGITINNGYADHVHRNMIYKWTDHDNDAEHKQTYDYDDFYKIYEECLTNAAGQNVGHPNSIIFRIQDETTTYNRSTYGGTKSGARVAESKSSLSTDDLSKIDSGNGWEVLRNRYGQPIDLFGTVVSEPSSPTAVGNNVRVVSTGYNANIAGDYGTAWKVYKKNGTTGYSLIKDSTSGRYAAPPSIFLLRGNASGYNSAVATVGYPEADHSVTGVGSYTDSISKYEGIYKNAYKDTSVKGKPVYITYEKDAQDTRDDSSGTGAYRLDGRWYYTHAADSVQSTVGIEYWDNTTATWKKDTVSASTGNGTSGGTNKNNVKFNSNSYAGSDNVTTSKATYINDETPLNFTATAGTDYIFEGWYIKYSDTSYDKIVGAAEAASIKATANYELVARFLPIVTGSLTIDHKLTGSSTGEGTVDMTVIVKDGNTTKETYTGSRVYIDGTYISNSYATYTIDVTLKTTPQYDGKVSAFGYDKFNTKNSITATTSPTTLPGAENGLTTSHFTFTVGQLYSGSTLSTTALNYTSTIDATPHYYNFVYNLTTRDTQSKSYTAKGEISLKDYKQYVTGSHSLDPSFVKAKAPFESNFLKKNTLPNVTPTYTTGTHTFTATSTFEQQADIPTYTVRFKLPYNYYTTKSDDHKKYTVNGSTYNADMPTFDLLANYDEFVTVDASETKTGSQDNVSKSTAVNHTDNDFITAPDQVGSKYFSYWSIKRLADTAAAQATAPEVARIYYPDFHYRIYGDYYVEAVFSDKAADSWHNTYSDTNDSGCSILYVGDSRNQWNNGSGNTNSSESVAADKIYSDFIFNYRNNGAELKNSDKVNVGMIIERVVDNSSGTRKWAVGSADVSDMSYYEKQNYGTGYDAESVKADILAKLGDADSLSSATKRSGCVYVDWNTSDLNNKNNLEENYSVYSAYGQTVGDHSIKFTTDNAIDTYVYRAYAVMKYDSDNNGTPDKWCISDPAYFCMRYTANLKYSE